MGVTIMIPTSIDGTDITGATIDGTDVTEITVDGQTVFGAVPGSLIAHYTFDDADTSGSTAKDVVGGFDGTINGSVTTGVTGKFGEAYDIGFGGNDNVQTTLNLSDQSLTDFSIAFFIKQSNFTDDTKRVYVDSDDGTNRLTISNSFGSAPNDMRNFDFANETPSGINGLFNVDISGDLTNGAFNLIVCVFDPGASDGYKVFTNNGTLSAASSDTSITLPDANSVTGRTQFIGAGAVMDDLKIYNKALSVTEIQSLNSTGSIL